MLIFSKVGRNQYKRALQCVTAMKGPRSEALRHLTEEIEVIQACAQLDPTPKYKYIKWILTRLYRDVESIAKATVGEDGRTPALKGLLVEFEAVKHRLQPHMRDIFNYRTVEALEEVLVLERKDRMKASKMICSNWGQEDVLADTQIMEAGDLTVHLPRCIEDVIILTGSDEVFDLRGKKRYKDLADSGQVYVFNTGYGMLIGSLPREQGERGLLYDAFGEHAMFEDALMVHQELDWETAPDILELMCKIDPALPFDEGMEEVALFAAALNQFPLVLHEDREIPDSILDELLESDLLNEKARAEIAELA
jgi:hypothetical protein